MMTDRSAEMSRRAFILATAVLAAGCIRSEPGGRVRLAAGRSGRAVSGVRGDSRETDPGPLSGRRRRRAPHRGQRRKPGPPALGRRRYGPRTGRRCRAGSSHRPRGNRTTRGGPGVRELSAGDGARLRCRATAFRSQGMRVSIGAASIRRCGDQRGAVRGGRPSRSSRHAEVPPEGGTSSARGRQRRRAGVVGRRTDTGHHRPGCQTATPDTRHRPVGDTDEPISPATRTSSAECRPAGTCHPAYVLSECPTCCCAAKTSPPTWSPRSWTYSQPTRRTWCLPTSGGCSTSTHRR